VTFDAVKTAIKSHVNMSSPEADTRIGDAINRHYRRITSVLGMDATRFVTRSASTTNGVQTVTFEEIEKIDRVLDVTDSAALRLLPEISVHQQRSTQPGTGEPCSWALQNAEAESVTILLDTLPQTEYDLQADGWTSLADLQGNDVPAFPESFHDILIFAGIAEELWRKEKAQMAVAFERKAQLLTEQLVMHLADSHTKDLRQAGSTLTTSVSGSGGGGGTQGGSAYTQSGLLTFDRGAGIAPFAVARTDAATVTNLDADKLDGEQGTFYLDRANHTGTMAASALPIHNSRHENGGDDEMDVTGLSGLLADGQTPLAHQSSHNSGGSDALKLDDLATPDDNTDLNASTTRHGLLKKLSGTATEFLNGAGNFAALTVSDLPTSGEWLGEEVSVSAGGGTESFKLAGQIDYDDTQVTTSGATETALRTFTLPANTLNATGRTVIFRAWGTLAADTDNKIVRVRLGGIGGTIATQVSQNLSAYTRWEVLVRIIRLALNSQRVIGTGTFYTAAGAGAAAMSTMTVTADTQGETAGIDIVCTGEGANAGDIVYEASTVEVWN
jgi:hypothetical protein